MISPQPDIGSPVDAPEVLEMRTILAVAATFLGAFVIVAFTATILETWASTRRNAETSYLIADQAMPQRNIVPAGFIPTAARR